MNISQIKNIKAFSIIEIMVAISILSFTFISLMYAFPLGLAINKSAENSTIASYLAQDKLEELHSLGYDNVATGVIEVKDRLSSDSSNYLYHFFRETEVIYLDEDLAESVSDLGMKKISTTIYFNNAVSKSETSYNISTIISQK